MGALVQPVPVIRVARSGNARSRHSQINAENGSKPLDTQQAHQEPPSRESNERLKNAWFHSKLVASCHEPLSKAYYDRKRADVKGGDVHGSSPVERAIHDSQARGLLRREDPVLDHERNGRQLGSAHYWAFSQ